MVDRTDTEWQGKLKEILSEMKCPRTVQEALEGLEVLGIDVQEALEKLKRKREEWTNSKEFKEKLAELGLGEARCVFVFAFVVVLVFVVCCGGCCLPCLKLDRPMDRGKSPFEASNILELTMVYTCLHIYMCALIVCVLWRHEAHLNHLNPWRGLYGICLGNSCLHTRETVHLQ